MTKFTLAVLALYIFYYSANIFYDLYLKKTSEKNNADAEELFSVSDMAEKDHPEIVQIGIEDAETLNTPSSFTSRYFEEEPDTGYPQNATDLEVLRRKFEQEESMEDEDFEKLNARSTSENLAVSESTTEETSEPETTINQNMDADREKKFREMLNLAETTVQVLDIDGIRTYQSSLF